MGKTFRKDDVYSGKYKKEKARRNTRKEIEKDRWKEEIPDNKKNKNR